MTDNSVLPVSVGTETFANNDIGGIKYPRTKITWGAAGVANDASAANPLPISVISGTVTANIGTAGTLALESGGNLASIAGAFIAQGAALGANKDLMIAGSVTTAAPAYVNGQISPLSLTLAGAVRVDTAATLIAASTPPNSTSNQPSLLVSIRPDSQNVNGQALMTNSSPVVIASNQSSVPSIAGGSQYKSVAVLATDVLLGATGAVGDYLEGLLCIVQTPATSTVQIRDASGGTLMTVLPAGVAGGVGTYYIPLGIKTINVASPGWRVSTGAGVFAIATGIFT